MATNIKWRRRFFYTAGAEFIAGNFAGAKLRLRESDEDGIDDGAVDDFTHEGNGIWWVNIDIDTYASGYYLVEFHTDALGVGPDVYAAVGGCDPVIIDLDELMPLTGGTMSGNIVMGDKSITGVNSITFNDTAGTIGLNGGGAGTNVANGNLIDKTADETITGNWTFSGDCSITGSNSVTGTTSFTEDKCLSNSVIVQPYYYITHTWGGALDDENNPIDCVLFTCDTKITLLAVYECHNGTSTGACTIKLERLSDTETYGGGDDVSDAFDLEAAIDTVFSDETLANAAFAVGDRVAVYVSGGDETGADNVHITIKYRYGN